ncbi:MAG: adenylosuccinate synthase [Chloroflexi bacterium]|nr:adenylosuccinate synthase [Chloroflexota bacterium]MCL5952400.1 adenylosuccinate synthase [Chloroflexota bacterium]
MAVTVVLGTQWGDEGKGKAIDFLAGKFDFVARFNGGNNAGHTVINSFGTFRIHLVPSGIFYPHTRCLIGGGVVIDPAVLIQELGDLEAAGVHVGKRLSISPRAHLIMPYHRILDGLYEDAKGKGAIGTTRRGIGPAFADKVSYNGIRVGDLADPEVFEDKLRAQLAVKNKLIVALGGAPIDFKETYTSYLGYYEMIKKFVAELAPIVHQGLKKNKFLLEQAMGTFLDPDWGTYPFVTASTTLASAATGGLGIPPREITHVLGVTKAYTTRVGAGPMPTEIVNPQERSIRDALTEVAATTGRTRRAGWLDLELVRSAAQLSGIDGLFVTKLDVLSQFETIQVGVGYQWNGKRARYFDIPPYRLRDVHPIYRQLRGWQKDIREVRRFADLPRQAQRYIEFIEEQTDVPVHWISVGPERQATIKR